MNYLPHGDTVTKSGNEFFKDHHHSLIICSPSLVFSIDCKDAESVFVDGKETAKPYKEGANCEVTFDKRVISKNDLEADQCNQDR